MDNYFLNPFIHLHDVISFCFTMTGVWRRIRRDYVRIKTMNGNLVPWEKGKDFTAFLYIYFYCVLKYMCVFQWKWTWKPYSVDHVIEHSHNFIQNKGKQSRFAFVWTNVYKNMTEDGCVTQTACRIYFQCSSSLMLKRTRTSVIIMAELMSTIEKEWRYSAHKPEPAAPHATGPARSCFVWFPRGFGAICAVCPAQCMRALWGTPKRKNNN